jgi:hypothetical protein
MEIMSGLAVLTLGALAVFMYFKTRPPAPSPVVGLDLSAFSAITDDGVCARVREAGRRAVGSAGAEGADEECLSDGARFVYRSRGRQGGRAGGTAVVLLDKDLGVLGVKRTIS